MYVSNEIVQNPPSVSPLVILLGLCAAIFWRVIVKIVAVTLLVLLLYGIAQFVQLAQDVAGSEAGTGSVQHGDQQMKRQTLLR